MPAAGCLTCNFLSVLLSTCNNQSKRPTEERRVGAEHMVGAEGTPIESTNAAEWCLQLQHPYNFHGGLLCSATELRVCTGCTAGRRCRPQRQAAAAALEWPRLAVGWPDGHRLGLTECEMGSDKPARAPHGECARAALGPGPRLPPSFYLAGVGRRRDKMSHRKARRWRRGVPARAGAVARRPAAARPLAAMWWSGSRGCSACSACMAAPVGACRRPTLCWRLGLQPRRVKCNAARDMMAGRPQRGVPAWAAAAAAAAAGSCPARPLAACSEGCVADLRSSYTLPVCSSSTPGECWTGARRWWCCRRRHRHMGGGGGGDGLTALTRGSGLGGVRVLRLACSLCAALSVAARGPQ